MKLYFIALVVVGGSTYGQPENAQASGAHLDAVSVSKVSGHLSTPQEIVIGELGRECRKVRGRCQ